MSLLDAFDNTAPVGKVPSRAAAFDNTAPGSIPAVAPVQGPSITGVAYADPNTTVTIAQPFLDRIPVGATVEVQVRFSGGDPDTPWSTYGGLSIAAGDKVIAEPYAPGGGTYLFRVRYVSATLVSEWSQPFGFNFEV